MIACREQLLELYRTAGFGKRLDMYMQFPELRSYYNDIEKRGQKDASREYVLKMVPSTQ